MVGLLERYGLATADPTGRPCQVSVMSFSPLALRRVRRLAPGLPTVMLYEISARLTDDLPPLGAESRAGDRAWSGPGRSSSRGPTSAACGCTCGPSTPVRTSSWSLRTRRRTASSPTARPTSSRPGLGR